MSIESRWAEYKLGTLVTPAVIQRITVAGVHQVWVHTGTTVIGPMNFDSWNVSVEAKAVAMAVALEETNLEFETEIGGVL